MASLSEGSNDDERNDDADKDSISYYEWACSNESKSRKVLVKKSVDECISLFNTTVATVKHHIHVKRVQLVFYSDVKNNLARNDILIHLDYSESYENKQQREIQSAYFGHTTFSIFTACFYFLDVDNRVTCKSIAITSELPDHCRLQLLAY